MARKDAIRPSGAETDGLIPLEGMGLVRKELAPIQSEIALKLTIVTFVKGL